MTRVYKSTPPANGPAPPGPRPQGMGPRPGVQAVVARKPRVGPSAYEADGERLPPPLNLAAEAQHSAAFNGAREQSDIQLETFSTGTARSLPGNPAIEFQFCILCGVSDKDAALLIDARDDDQVQLGHDGHRVCDKCVERLMTRLHSEIPKRRLRLALERMMAGEVSAETVEAVERLACVPQRTSNDS